MKRDYAFELATAKGLDDLDAIVESASFDDALSNAEYERIYNAAMEIAQAWNVI